AGEQHEHDRDQFPDSHSWILLKHFSFSCEAATEAPQYRSRFMLRECHDLVKNGARASVLRATFHFRNVSFVMGSSKVALEPRNDSSVPVASVIGDFVNVIGIHH